MNDEFHITAENLEHLHDDLLPMPMQLFDRICQLIYGPENQVQLHLYLRRKGSNHYKQFT